MEVVTAGSWPFNEATDSVTLVFDERHRRRVRMTTDAMEDVLLDLPTAVALGDGDGLHLEDGNWVAVTAAPEPLLEVIPDSQYHLMRLVWHIGNRHLQAELLTDRIRIRPDQVIAEMLRGLGAKVTEVMAPFQPEGGAYEESGHSPV